MVLHRRGVLHRQNRRLRALLSKPCVVLDEIANRVGVTRQRVHQIAVQMEIDCGERRDVCTVSRVENAVAGLLKNDSLLSAIKEACQREGLRLDTLPTQSGLIQLKKVTINDQFCRLRHTTLSRLGYVAFGAPPDHQGEKFLLYLLMDGRWMVIPRESAPPRRSSFALEPPLSNRGRKVRARHDYRQFIEAWHLLKHNGQRTGTASGHH